MRKFVKIGLGCLLGFFLVYGGIIVGYNLEHRNKTVPIAQTKTEQPPTRAELLKLVNQVRAKHGVAPLVENPILDKSAQWKADDMVRYNYYGHVKPGTAGNDGLDYLNSLKPACVYISENLADNVYLGTNTPDNNTSANTVSMWYASTPHREAMLNPKYTLTGFGVNGTLVVEHFCQP